MQKNSSPRDYLSLKQRTAILIIYTALLYFIGAYFTKSMHLTGGGEWLWWLSAVAFYTVNMLSAPFFSRPRDTLANALVCAPMLFTLDLSPLPGLRPQLEFFRWVTFGYVIVIACLAIISMILHEDNPEKTWRITTSRLSYDLAISLGNEELLYTFPAILSIVGFYQLHPLSMLCLILVWMFILFAKPIQLIIISWMHIMDDLLNKRGVDLVGKIIRVDDPSIVRVSLNSADTWNKEHVHSGRLPGNQTIEIIPMFVQIQDEQLIGTGLFWKRPHQLPSGISQVWRNLTGADSKEVFKRMSGQDDPVDLSGFVVEGSHIQAIRFESIGTSPISEGTVVFVRDNEKTIYYQVLDAVTDEESFTENPLGKQIVIASQLGLYDEMSGFSNYGWVPSMNSPVFRPLNRLRSTLDETEDEFWIGNIPDTDLPVKANLSDMMHFHTAILGVTGTGKTELVFDIVRAHIKAGRKVFCVDFTGEYKPRLSDLHPSEIGFDSDSLRELDEKVNATEHGTFGAPEEKKQLHDWVVSQRCHVKEQIAQFISADNQQLGIFDLPDIANTRATLRATEMYLSAIFEWARKNRGMKEIVVVLEEAHTIIPENNMFRNDKADSDSVVGRMAQIALQGRKYGVGLLLVSQRTALVSKTLLSQCNTCICFAMYDKTGMDYLESVFASSHVRAIPNLRFLQGVAFGKALRSDRPIIFQIPEDPAKREASEKLNQIEPKDELVAGAPAQSIVDEIRTYPRGVGLDDELPF